MLSGPLQKQAQVVSKGLSAGPCKSLFLRFNSSVIRAVPKDFLSYSHALCPPSMEMDSDVAPTIRQLSRSELLTLPQLAVCCPRDHEQPQATDCFLRTLSVA